MHELDSLTFSNAIQFVTDNWGTIMIVITALAPLIRETRARKVLQATVNQLAVGVEIYGSPKLKQLIQALGCKADPEVNRAITHAAQRADPDKPNPKDSIAVKVLNQLPLTGPVPERMIAIGASIEPELGEN